MSVGVDVGDCDITVATPHPEEKAFDFLVTDDMDGVDATDADDAIHAEIYPTIGITIFGMSSDKHRIDTKHVLRFAAYTRCALESLQLQLHILQLFDECVVCLFDFVLSHFESFDLIGVKSVECLVDVDRIE